MKTTILIITAFFIMTLMSNCVDYADEDIVVNGESTGLSLYKTKKDYSNFITLRLDSNNSILMAPSYNAKDPRISYENGKVKYNLLWILKNDYVLCEEMMHDLVFTDITFQEFVDYTEKNGGDIPDDWFLKRIIDKDPFTEFYYLKNEFRSRNFTIGEMNEIIKNETIENYFTKIK